MIAIFEPRVDENFDGTCEWGGVFSHEGEWACMANNINSRLTSGPTDQMWMVQAFWQTVPVGTADLNNKVKLSGSNCRPAAWPLHGRC